MVVDIVLPAVLCPKRSLILYFCRVGRWTRTGSDKGSGRHSLSRTVVSLCQQPSAGHEGAEIDIFNIADQMKAERKI